MKLYGSRSARPISLGYYPQSRLKPRGIKVAEICIAVVFFALVAIVWIASTTGLQSAERVATEAGETRAAVVAKSYASYLSERVATADILTRVVAFEYTANKGAIDLHRLVAGGLLIPTDETLVTVVDQAGVTRQSWPASVASSLSLADRPHFVAQRNNPEQELFIGAPVVGRVSGHLSIQFTRRLSVTDNNDFAGVVVVSEPLSFLTRSFANRANLGKNGRLFVYRADGALLSAANADGTTSSNGPALASFPKEEAATQIDTSTDHERTYFRKAVADFPLVVVVSLSQADVRADFRRQAMLYWIWACVATLGLALAAMAAVIAARAILTNNAEVNHLATTDFLTGLGNRRVVMDFMAARRARGSRSPVALISIDIHNFGAINSKYGYDTGDRVLSQIAGRIQALSDPTDPPAVRLQADQFMVIVSGQHAREKALARARSVVESFRAPLAFEFFDEMLLVSIGIGTSDTEGAEPENMLIQTAYALDLAKRATLQSGESEYRIVDTSMVEAQIDDRDREFELEAAVRGGEPKVFPSYSTIIDCATRSAIGVVIAPAWRRSPTQQLAYDDFRSLAEKLKLTDFVYKQAIEQAVDQIAHSSASDTILCVRAPVSLVANVDPSFYVLPDVLAPQRMRFALTGLQDLQAGDPVFAKVSALKKLGVQLYLALEPDAGISPNVLNDLPIDGIALDGQWLAQFSASYALQFMEGILSGAAQTQWQIMIDGVQQIDQLDHLAQLGVIDACGPCIDAAFPAASLLR